jgi:hypothetical protein
MLLMGEKKSKSRIFGIYQRTSSHNLCICGEKGDIFDPSLSVNKMVLLELIGISLGLFRFLSI